MAIYDVTDLEVYRRSLESLKLIYKISYKIRDTFKQKKYDEYF